MEHFLKDNWIWIVAPVVMVAVAIAALVVFGESSDVGPMIYNVY